MTRLNLLTGTWGLEFTAALIGDNLVVRPKTARNGEDALKFMLTSGGPVGVEVKVTYENGYKLDVGQLQGHRWHIGPFYSRVLYVAHVYNLVEPGITGSLSEVSATEVAKYLAYHLNASYLLDSDIICAINSWKGSFKWRPRGDALNAGDNGGLRGRKRPNRSYVRVSRDILTSVFEDFSGFCRDTGLCEDNYHLQAWEPDAVKFRGKRLWNWSGVHAIVPAAIAEELSKEVTRRFAAAHKGEFVEVLDQLYPLPLFEQGGKT